MSMEPKPAPPSRAWVWTGWIVSLLPSLALIFSAAVKFVGPQEMLKEFERLGYKPELATPLGVVEILCTIIYLIPQTSVLGAILLTGYLGGATATHVRVGDQFIPPIVMGVLIWLGIFLREPRLRAILPWRN
jgi:xanthine/uracil permease